MIGPAIAPPRALIVNADDFGLTEGVNAGIIGARRRGIVRGASLLVTAPGFADAARLAREEPLLDLGIHLALTGGLPPALPPGRVPTLVGPDGRFPPLRAWLGRVARGALDPAEVRAELRAQLARARDTGLPFTHLDGHHHAHLFPGVAAAAGALAREFGIPSARRIDDATGAWAGLEPLGPRLKRRLLATTDAQWGAAYDGLARADAFAGFHFPATLAGWERLADALPTGVTEMMCHPGLVDPVLRRLDSYREEREAELRWLCDPRVAALFDERGIAIVGFAEARGRGLLRMGAAGG